MNYADQSHRASDISRLVGFSDGVIAIAITLLILNIEVPTATDPTGVATALFAERGDVLSYVLSFLVIGNYWTGHHVMFQWIDRQDHRLLWINLLFLLCVAFIPFPTALLGETISTITVSVYAATLTLTGILSAGLWWYATGPADLASAAITPIQRRNRTIRSLAPSSVFALSILIAQVDPVWAMYCWAALVVVDPVVDRLYP